MVKELTLPFDLSGRTAMLFVQAIQEALKTPIQIGDLNRRVNAKSLLGILSLGVKKRDTVSVFYQEEGDLRVMEEIINSLREELQW